MKKLIVCIMIFSQFILAKSQQIKISNKLYYEIQASTRNKDTTNVSTTFFYIKQDSTFIEVSGANNYVNVASVGKWKYLGDSILEFKYGGALGALWKNEKITYEKGSGGNSDSVYISGRITDFDGRPISFASIMVASTLEGLQTTNFGFASDADGYFKHQIHYRRNPFVLKVTSMALETFTFELDKNKNIHKLYFSSPAVDTRSWNSERDDYSNYQNCRALPEGRVKKMGLKKSWNRLPSNNDATLLINYINRAMLLQPHLKTHFKEVLNFIQK